MPPDSNQIRSTIELARAALRRGDQAEARLLAEQISRLAPENEDALLILAAVSGPRESLEYAQRALTINPQSQRARKALDWARSRAGVDSPSVDAAGAGGVRSVLVGEQNQPYAEEKSNRRGLFVPILLMVILVCALAVFAAWSARNSSALASFLPQKNSALPATPTADDEIHFAAANLSKPTYTPEWTFTPSFTPTPTFTLTPSITPTLPFTETPLPTDTPGVMEVSIVPDTPTPIAPPTSAAPTQAAYVPPSSGGSGERWIDVNLSTQTLYAYEGDVMVRAFTVSTGVAATPTVTGTYKIYARYLYADMHGPGYFLPDVPYTMYFYKSYGIHGTYWHNNFGTPMSHGCVNMSIPDAEWVYNWSTFGTTVNVHY